MKRALSLVAALLSLTTVSLYSLPANAGPANAGPTSTGPAITAFVNAGPDAAGSDSALRVGGASGSKTDEKGAGATVASGQKIVIPISVYSDAQLGSYWTMRMANGLQGKGAVVTILLFTNGVRLADNRAEDDFGIEGEPIPISKYFTDFTGAGGKIYVESDYATKIGLKEEFLRTGARFADDRQMCDMILSADKILSF